MMFCLREIYVIYRVKVVMLEKPSKSEIVVPSGIRFKDTAAKPRHICSIRIWVYNTFL